MVLSGLSPVDWLARVAEHTTMLQASRTRNECNPGPAIGFQSD